MDETFTLVASGKTYECKDQLKNCGFQWDANSKTWLRHDTSAERAGHIYQKEWPIGVLFKEGNTIPGDPLAVKLSTLESKLSECRAIIDEIKQLVYGS
jgi:hypothetical protein